MDWTIEEYFEYVEHFLEIEMNSFDFSQDEGCAQRTTVDALMVIE